MPIATDPFNVCALCVLARIETTNDPHSALLQTFAYQPVRGFVPSNSWLCCPVHFMICGGFLCITLQLKEGARAIYERGHEQRAISVQQAASGGTLGRTTMSRRDGGGGAQHLD